MSKPYYQDEWLTIHGGDNREVMRTLPAESVQCVVTSPPYWGLRDYGTPGQLGLEPTPEAYVAAMVDVFREVRRVLRKDGTLWLNLGDSYANTGGSASAWATPKEQAKKRTGNADLPPRLLGALKPKDLVGIPWRVAFALQADGWYLRSDIIWSKPNPMPESVTDRPTKAHEYLFLLSKSATYCYDADAIREPLSESTVRIHGSDAVATRHGERKADLVGNGHSGLVNGPDRLAHMQAAGGRNRRSVWTIATRPYPGAHFATFPEALVEPCILAGCPEGGVVMDPFGGTGTVGSVANRLSRRAVLIDLNPEYLTQCLERNRQSPLGLSA